MAVSLGLLYVADLVFCLNFAVGERQGELFFSRYFGIIPDFVYVAAIAWLSVAAQLYPLAPQCLPPTPGRSATPVASLFQCSSPVLQQPRAL